MSERKTGTVVLASMILTAALSGLALGALWALLAASIIANATWLAFGAAAGMVFSMRFSSPRASWFAAVLAALGTLLAAFYAECLQLAMRIAAQFGLPLLDVIHTSGIASSSQLTWRLLPTQHVLVYSAAALLAFIATLWPARSDPDKR